MMRRFLLALLVFLAPVSARAACTVPYIFQNVVPGGPQQIIDAIQVNADFQAVLNCIASSASFPLDFGTTVTPGTHASPLVVGTNTLYVNLLPIEPPYTAAHQVQPAEVQQLILANGVGAVPFILPAAGDPGFEAGRSFYFKDVGSAGFTLQTLSGGISGIPLAGGVATLMAGSSATAISDPPNWDILYDLPSGALGCATATSQTLGCSRPDNVTLTISSGVLAAVPAASCALATSSTTGCSRPDNTTLTISNGVLSAVPAAGCALATSSTTGCSRPDNSTITVAGGVLTAHTTACSLATGSTTGCVQPDGVTIGVNGSGVISVIQKPSEVAMSWPGTVPAGQVYRVAQAVAKTCVAGFTGSVGNSKAASSATTVVNINQVTAGVVTNRGTMTWSGSTIGPATPASSGGMTLAANDDVEFAFPNPADPSLADVAITILCSRT